MKLGQIVEQLNWRIATKLFDPTKKVSDVDFEQLMEAVRLAPSSFGLQPWKFVVVKDPHLRIRLREAGHNQPQITDASHFVVLCSKTDLTPEYINSYINSIAEGRQVDAATLADFKQSIVGSVNRLSSDEVAQWNSRQVYIALGTLVTVCAVAQIDACPMEGFDHQKFDEILGLKAQSLQSRALCAIGYRSANDRLSKVKKVRFSKAEVVEEK